MVLEFAVDDNTPCWFYSLVIDDFGNELWEFEGDFNADPAWDFLVSDQEH